MKKNPSIILFFSLLVAVLPLLTGSVIFWVWFYHPYKNLDAAGAMTILIALPLCIIGLIVLMVLKYKNKANLPLRKKANRIIYLILGNIPLCGFYLWFACYIMDTDRITIINNTGNDVTDLKIIGPGDVCFITSIEKGNSKTAWIHMTHDGSIVMEYKENGKKQEHFLSGYTGVGMGKKYEQHIHATPEDLEMSEDQNIRK